MAETIYISSPRNWNETKTKYAQRNLYNAWNSNGRDQELNTENVSEPSDNNLFIFCSILWNCIMQWYNEQGADLSTSEMFNKIMDVTTWINDYKSK